MADQTTVHIGENSPENIAYKLYHDIVGIEGGVRDRKSLLDLYAECLVTVKSPRDRVAATKNNTPSAGFTGR